MEFLKIYDNAVSPNTCKDIINYYKTHYEEEAKDQYPIPDAPIRELTVSGKNDTFWDTLESELKNICQEKLQDYLASTKYKETFKYRHTHLSIMQYKDAFNKPSHYDTEFDYKDGQEMMRLFAILIYLNNDFSGGELMFPLQNKVISPKPGLLTIFPTSFMYPHLTLPAFGGERFVLRMNYYINKECL